MTGSCVDPLRKCVLGAVLSIWHVYLEDRSILVKTYWMPCLQTGVSLLKGGSQGLLCKYLPVSCMITLGLFAPHLTHAIEAKLRIGAALNFLEKPIHL